MRIIPTKYQPVELPKPEEAIAMAKEREEWAQQARERDQYGSAREWELTALLLRHYRATTA